MNGEKLKYGIRNNHHVLVKRLSTLDFLPNLFSEGLVSPNEKSQIQHQPADGLKTDMLLDIINRQGVSDPKVYTRFFALLSDKSVMSGQNLGEVVQKIKKDSLSEEVARKFVYQQVPLKDGERAAIFKHMSTIEESVSVDEVLPELISAGAISPQEKEDIK